MDVGSIIFFSCSDFTAAFHFVSQISIQAEKRKKKRKEEKWPSLIYSIAACERNRMMTMTRKFTRRDQGQNKSRTKSQIQKDKIRMTTSVRDQEMRWLVCSFTIIHI